MSKHRIMFRGLATLPLLLLIAAPIKAGIPVTYYDTATTVSGPALKSSLNDIVTTGFTQVGYGNANAALYVTDEDPSNSSNVIMIYGADSRPKSGSSGSSDGNGATGGWNREHSFPQSFFNENEPMRSDLHALFPCDVDTNTQRSNHPYDIIASPTYPPPYYTDGFGNIDSNSPAGFEPANVDKGRVARAILYMDVRYEAEGGEPNLTVINSLPGGTGAGQMAYLNRLLDWHRLYPPTAFERARNQKAYNRQGNGNPLTDHPEWASIMFGGTAWTMANGDTITVTSTNRAPASATAGSANIPLLSLNLNLAANQFHIQQIAVSNQGTAIDSEITNVKLWYDVDNNGSATNVDTLLDTRTFSGGLANFVLSHPFYVAPGNTHLLVTGSISVSAVTGRTVILRADGSGNRSSFQRGQ